jgi:pimeloyl-ACP methyl ester carboxylesterase
VDWLITLGWIAIWSVFAIAAFAILGLLLVGWKYLHVIERIFEEKPFFLVKRAKPEKLDHQDVELKTSDGLTLAGTYLRTPAEQRKGVILFAPEYGASRWTCLSYCRSLLEEGYDLLTFDFRNFGESERMAQYDPLQWVTEYEVRDVQAALEYLKGRFDLPEKGIGFFGVSRGGGAGLVAASKEPLVKCVITDGAFGTLSTMVQYMKRWVTIYASQFQLQRILAHWAYCVLGEWALWRVARRRHCHFPSVERGARKLSPRPWLQIHGGCDSYITPQIARQLHAEARAPKELWLVEAAKHNQAIQVATDEYKQRLLDFFGTHLAEPLPVETAPETESKEVEVGV